MREIDFDDMTLDVEAATNYHDMRDAAETAKDVIWEIRAEGDYAKWKPLYDQLAEAVFDWVMENDDPDGEDAM